MSISLKSQAVNLRRVLQNNAKSSLFTQLDIRDLYREKDFDFLYQEFTSRVPVFTHSALMKSLNRVVAEPSANPVQLMGRKELWRQKTLPDLALQVISIKNFCL